MAEASLTQIAVLLGAAAVAAPLARTLRIGSVLGYLGAGAALGPYGLGGLFSISEAQEILHAAEFGVVLLLFLIGLELRPKRLWSMRMSVFGGGSVQVAATAALLALLVGLLGLSAPAALFVGLALSLSSTAFALQILDENGELPTRHGRLAFAILLFQDLAAIPLIALAPMFVISQAGASGGFDPLAIARAIFVIAAVVVIGRFVLDHFFRLIAGARMKEAMTAAALLTVVGVSLVMQKAGLSASLGAFIAGALLAESSYRHQLEADIKPFEGLLLGLFFTAVGMSLNIALIVQYPLMMLGLVGALVLLKSAVLYGIGRWYGLDGQQSRRLAFTLSQGGEFAFVLFTAGAAAGVLGQGQADVFAVVVTLSMVATPLLLIADRLVSKPPTSAAERPFDPMPDNDSHVLIAGFGRFGQIVGRVLRAKRIPFTALDVSPDQVAFVERFGGKAFYGDASRPEVLEAAQIGKARAFVLAIDDVEASMRTVESLRQLHPDLPIYARARNRIHAHRLMDAGVKLVRRETFLASLDLTREVLMGIGYSSKEAERTVTLFRAHDERRLGEDYKHWTDEQKLQEKARSDAANLERLFDEDIVEERKADRREVAAADRAARKEPV